jgi:adenosylmethionine-8-amino-7-oxononanoate aminotransferase
MPYCQMKTAPLPEAVVATEGVHLILADGRRLIDGMASWWSACHGYNHPHIRGAVEEQLRRMPHVMFGGIQHKPALKLASRLAHLLPGDLNRVFFSDSGSVAVEVAMKMAVQFWRNRGTATRNRFVSFHNAYHGDTTGAMSLCDPQRSMHAHFRGALLEQYCREIPDTTNHRREFDQFLEEHREELAGVFIEPLVQGAGGMRFHAPDVVAFVRETCDRHDVLLIADELATGFGRTGSMFAVEQADVVPDIICLGKALAGGTMGMAATVATERVFEAFLADDPTFALMHGPTFMANPLACAAANASLDLFETEPRLQQARAMEGHLAAALEACRGMPHVVDVRCKGAVGVIQVDELYQLDRLRGRFVERGVWVRPFGDVIYLTPSLSMEPDDLALLCDTLVSVVDEWSRWDGN